MVRLTRVYASLADGRVELGLLESERTNECHRVRQQIRRAPKDFAVTPERIKDVGAHQLLAARPVASSRMAGTACLFRRYSPADAVHWECSLMSRLTTLVSLFLLVSTLVGCATESPVLVTSQELAGYGDARLAASDVIAVGITQADRSRVDNLYLMSGNPSFRVETGPTWARAFVGDPAADPMFQITSAKLQSRTTAAGFAGRMVYVIHGRIIVEGRELPVQAEGSIGYSMNLFAGVREAVELGVADTVIRVRELLRVSTGSQSGN